MIYQWTPAPFAADPTRSHSMQPYLITSAADGLSGWDGPPLLLIPARWPMQHMTSPKARPCCTTTTVDDRYAIPQTHSSAIP